jgi:hypothetical protein
VWLSLREVIFSHGRRAKAKKILPKVYRRPNSGEGGIGKFPFALQEHAVACPVISPLSDLPFAATQSPPATDEAEEWGEVSVAD